MLLSEAIKGEEFIILDIEARDKREVIEKLVEKLVESKLVKDKEKVISAIMQREEIESTGIGGGIAIPHARCEEVDDVIIVFARSIKGVDFEALDGKPVHLIFLILAPQKARKEYLQAVAKVARLLKSKVMKKALLNAKSVEDIIKVIADFDGIAPEEVKVKMKEGRIVYKNNKKEKS